MAIYTNTASQDLGSTVKRVYMVNVVDTLTTPSGSVWVILRDGGSAGTQMLNIRVGPGESRVVVLARPLAFPSGLYVAVAGGVLRWSIDGT